MILEKMAPIRSRAKMKNKNLHEENIAQIAQKFARLLMRATCSSRLIFSAFKIIVCKNKSTRRLSSLVAVQRNSFTNKPGLESVRFFEIL